MNLKSNNSYVRRKKNIHIQTDGQYLLSTRTKKYIILLYTIEQDVCLSVA